MVKPADIAARRSRIARVNSKRPRVVVEIEAVEAPGARDEFVDLLLELLDHRRHSGAR